MPVAEMRTGWIKLYRSIEDNWIWSSERFSYQAAWIDLLVMVNHEDKKIMVNGQLIVIHAGQKLTSIRKLADRWKWGKDRVTKFLDMLQSDGMIYRDSRTRSGTLVTIVNYGLFQSKDEQAGTRSGTQTGTQAGTRLGTQTSHKQELKNDKEVKNNKRPRRSADGTELE